MSQKEFHFQDLICDLGFSLSEKELNEKVSQNALPSIFAELAVLLLHTPSNAKLPVLYSNLGKWHLRLLADIFPSIVWKKYDEQEADLAKFASIESLILFDTNLERMERVLPAVGLLTTADGRKVIYTRTDAGFLQLISVITLDLQEKILEALDVYLNAATNLKKPADDLKSRVRTLFEEFNNTKPEAVKETLSSITKHIKNPVLKKQYVTLYNQVVNQVLEPTITFGDIKHRLPYSEHNHIKKTSLHIGQRKLFMNELQFLTSYVDPQEKVLCVYAGAAPSNKTGFLSDLFPNVTFLLVDPNPFDIVGKTPVYLSSIAKNLVEARKILAKLGKEPIYIINGLFTDILATAISELGMPVVFISDIRTSVDGTGKASSFDIVWNLSMQYNWVNIIKPRACMLKFRHPFYQDMKPNFRKISEQLPYAKDFEVSKKYGIDFVTDAENKKLTYLTGITYIQPWAGIFSTEARHVTDSLDIQEHITLNEYEDKFYYYNNIERCYVKHQNDNADRSLGFDHCNDCALENYIWKQYIEKYRSTLNVKNLVKKLSAVTKRTLLREDHGHLF